ncbi:MAG: hypothetical protein ABJC66_10860 [Gammaproteobacteria bacterium]
MSTPRKNHRHLALPLGGVALAFLAATLLGGCVVQERVGPPPRAYVPPPPPAYADQGYVNQAYADPGSDDVEARASEAPPPLPEYDQPPCPEDGYMWTPGYWAWGGGGYYWVPGTWVQPPRFGVLWTPGYWGFLGGVYLFHAGYWGPQVGFYGGVNYGYGYGGVGFAGGRWSGDRFAYNRTVTNVNVTVVHNTYNERVVNNVTVNRASYNGGSGGVAAVATARERTALRDRVPPTPMQRQHFQEAIKNPALEARANGGHPAIAATPRPAAFNAPGVIGARGAGAPATRSFAPPMPGSQGRREQPAYQQRPQQPAYQQQQQQTQRPTQMPRTGQSRAQAPAAAGARSPAARPPAAKPPADRPPRNEKREPEH